MTPSRHAALSVFSTLAGIAVSLPGVARGDAPRNATPAPSSPKAQGAPAGALPPPNVIVFITDDESWLERSAYGWSNLPTPHFDRVAREGVLFNRCYTSAPSCAPSRASLLTGRNFWELEQGAFIQGWLPAKFPRLPDLLQSAGYHTGYTGKGWGPGLLPPDAPKKNPAGTAYNQLKRKAEKGMSNIDYPANLNAFLDQRPEGSPFYFWIGSIEPHTPLDPDNYKKLEARHGIKLGDVTMPGFVPDTPEMRRTRAAVQYEICHADDDLGRVIETLERRGLLENTIIFVTGDNGTQIPYSKATPYDWGVHEPLAVMWPARVKPGRRVDDFVNFADFAPTILAAAGAAIPGGMSGRSFLDVLLSEKTGRIDPARSWTVTGLEWHGELPPYSSAARAIRDERYHYIANYAIRPANRTPAGRGAPAELKPGEIWEELYDCETDPWQLTNLAASPAHAETKARLAGQLRDYQLQTRDPRATGDMKLFDETRALVEGRKKNNYQD
ncbi:sulfatase [Termitidicoccus mucosus]|uniref:Sulfatase N-terminal domain-containing protein n=1 Tax=Termitidicoccus mucosus TaxID=1184151 RepID=A0A178IDV3_9BACT|nr:hypothetical protein AW736_23625 [Opitutaceae bacterium TSB47]